LLILIAEKKQMLRDAPASPLFEACKTQEELKNIDLNTIMYYAMEAKKKNAT